MVFVDDLTRYEEHYWCHLFADTVQELHAFAKKLGLKREWFQVGRVGFPHYDLAGGTWRARAIAQGAIEVPNRLAVRLVHGCKGIEMLAKRGPAPQEATPWLE